MHANEINNSMFAATFLGSVVCPSKYNDNNDDYYDDYDHNYCLAFCMQFPSLIELLFNVATVEGQFNLANSVRDFPLNKRIFGDFQIKQWDFHKRCTRFSRSDSPLGHSYAIGRVC